MTESTTSTETPLWRFSLHFYRQAGVSDACIALQDACCVDVNLLLFLFWLAAGRRRKQRRYRAEANDDDRTG